MATKKKISIPSIIAAISFIYLAFTPIVIDPFLNLIMGNSFADVIRHSISSMLSLRSIICFWSYIIIVVGIFTKFDKIAVAVSGALFWFNTLISFIETIIHSIRYHYTLGFGGVVSALSYLLADFLVFAIALWLTILFFKKKETPKFLKIVAFAPVAVFALILFFSFFSDISNIISVISAIGVNIRYLLNTLIINLSGMFDRLVLVIGYAAVMIKLTDLKKKPKNTVEISENVVIENVTAE